MIKRVVVTPDEHIGATIKSLRTIRGISIRQLSDASGYSPSSISKWENGKRLPSIEKIRHLLAVMDAEIVVFDRRTSDN